MSGTQNKIALFVCDWAVNPDHVSSENLSAFPADVRLVKVKCVGRIDPTFLMDTYLSAIDGVLVIACEKGDCHFIEGDLQAENKIKMVEKLLSLVGFNKERIRFERMSALNEEQFKNSLTKFIDHIKTLGESPISERQPNPELQERILVAKATLEGFRTRALVSKELELTEKGNVYGEKISQLEFTLVQDEALNAEFYRNWIYLLLKRGSSSVVELSKRTGLREGQVLRHIVTMRHRNLVSFDKIEGDTPFYRALEVIR